MKRKDTYSVRVSVAGRDLGTWDKQEGGAVDSEETTYRPGGLQAQVTLGGAKTVEPITVTRLNDEVTHDVVHWLLQQAGKGDAVVTKQPLDADGNVFGRPLVYTGKLKRCTPPDVDSESGDAALIELEITCNGEVS